MGRINLSCYASHHTIKRPETKLVVAISLLGWPVLLHAENPYAEQTGLSDSMPVSVSVKVETTSREPIERSVPYGDITDSIGEVPESLAREDHDTGRSRTDKWSDETDNGALLDIPALRFDVPDRAIEIDETHGRRRFIGKKWGDPPYFVGRITIPEQGTYTGQARRWQRSGLGTMIYLSGGRYQGDWLDDKRHGRGVTNSPRRQRISRRFPTQSFRGRRHCTASRMDEIIPVRFQQVQSTGSGPCAGQTEPFIKGIGGRIAPMVRVPYHSPMLRDIVGNGGWVYAMARGAWITVMVRSIGARY